MSVKPFYQVPHSGKRMLLFVAADCLGLGLVVDLIVRLVTHNHWHGIYFLDSNFHQLGRLLRGRQLHDSWAPMLAALHYWQTKPGGLIYQGVFFDEHIKFQYPLTSLFPFLALNRIGLSDAQIIHLAGAVSYAAAGLVILLTGAVAQRCSVRCRNRGLDAAEILAIGIGGLLFFPLLKGVALGQVQTILTLGFAAGFYCWLRGREKPAGLLIGLIALVKPQYVLLLLWAGLRKRWGALFAGLISIALFVSLSLAVFGWRNNIEFLDVLHTLSRHGESFSANQSMNGTLNRLLANGPNLEWQKDQLPPFSLPVYAGTLLSSMLLLGVGLLPPRDPASKGGVADFACIALVATAASPVAWEHHYGILLPIFSWMWFCKNEMDTSQVRVALLAVSFGLVGSCLSPLDLFWRIPGLNILQSYIYIGALLLLGLLARAKWLDRTPHDILPYPPAAGN